MLFLSLLNYENNNLKKKWDIVFLKNQWQKLVCKHWKSEILQILHNILIDSMFL